jgi:hypothetical protein
MKHSKKEVFAFDEIFGKAGSKRKILMIDVLDHMVDILDTLSDFSEFASSSPEMTITVAPQVFDELKKSQDYGYLKATKEGSKFNDVRYMVFELATRGGGKLIIQEGTETSTLEVLQ